MKRVALVVAVSLCISAAAFAQTAATAPTREELVKMFDVLRVRQQTENVMQTTLMQMRQQIENDIQKRYPNLSPEAMKKIEESINGAVNIYPVNEMLEDLIPVYQKHLTKADVDAIVGFYSSPAGQHFLDKMPAVTQEAMSTMMTKMQVRSAAYANKVEQQAEELEKQ